MRPRHSHTDRALEHSFVPVSASYEIVVGAGGPVLITSPPGQLKPDFKNRFCGEFDGRGTNHL